MLYTVGGQYELAQQLLPVKSYKTVSANENVFLIYTLVTATTTELLRKLTSNY